MLFRKRQNFIAAFILLFGATPILAQTTAGNGGSGGSVYCYQCTIYGKGIGGGDGGRGGSAYSDAAIDTPRVQGERNNRSWFVIAGSWPSAEVQKLQARVSLLSKQGIKSRVIATDQFSKLSSGLSAVVLGPFKKDEARIQLGTVQASVPDAYMKEGL